MSFYTGLVEPMLHPIQNVQVNGNNNGRVHALIQLVVEVGKRGLREFQRGNLEAFEGLQGNPLSPVHAHMIAGMRLKGVDLRLEQLRTVANEISIQERGPLLKVLSDVGFDEAPITKGERFLIFSHLLHLARSSADPSKADPAGLRSCVLIPHNLYTQDLNAIVGHALRCINKKMALYIKRIGGEHLECLVEKVQPSPYLGMKAILQQIISKREKILIKFFEPGNENLRFKLLFSAQDRGFVGEEAPDNIQESVVALECETDFTKDELQTLDLTAALLGGKAKVMQTLPLEEELELEVFSSFELFSALENVVDHLSEEEKQRFTSLCDNRNLSIEQGSKILETFLQMNNHKLTHKRLDIRRGYALKGVV